MLFHGPSVDSMPPETVQDVIAHELAHVFQWATHDLEYVLNWDSGDCELDADETIEDWGFKADSVDEWAAHLGITKTIYCNSLADCVKRLNGPKSRYGRRRATLGDGGSKKPPVGVTCNPTSSQSGGQNDQATIIESTLNVEK